MLPVLTNDLLGVTPTEPGFATWTLQPHPGTVGWAQGKVPTPHGQIDVHWQQGPQSSLQFTVQVPEGTTAQLALLPGSHNVHVDGHTSAQPNAAGQPAAPSLGPGTHDITYQ